MKITLANKTELNAIMVTGGSRYVQGANRDTLTFIFPATQSMDELDALFIPENCETIVLGDGEAEGGIHHGYTVRVELKREPVVIEQATESADAVIENRTFVSMAQRTYMETKMMEMEAKLASIIGE